MCDRRDQSTVRNKHTFYIDAVVVVCDSLSLSHSLTLTLSRL